MWTDESAAMWLRFSILLAFIFPAMGCFVFEELDAGAESMKLGRSENSQSDASGSKDPSSSKGYTEDLQDWWKKARTLGTQTQDPSIRRCSLGGTISYMREDDCRSRGGVTSPSP